MSNRFLTRILPVVMFVSGISLISADSVNAALRRSPFRSYSTRYTRSFARPATGVGSNLHRRFVLKRELQRQQRGFPVRNRGNILWLRR